jgi:DMSO/TMAO reductase YedYZ molybdopterin-dependent catalytic subunit
VPLARAEDEQALLAYELNGQPLPPNHGFPLRAILPGVYGQKQPKWITGIKVTDREDLGPWELKGWSREAPIRLNSAIRVPHPDSTVARGDLIVAGIAHAGETGVDAVEISTDGGQTWNATVLTRGPSASVWTQWGFLFRNPAPGRYTLQVRATDNAGHRQGQTGPGLDSDVFPNGTSEIHALAFQVES